MDNNRVYYFSEYSANMGRDDFIRRGIDVGPLDWDFETGRYFFRVGLDNRPGRA